MSLDSILQNCHDVYMIEETDEYESYSGMVGKFKYVFNLLSYPDSILNIESSDHHTMYNGNPNDIKSVQPIEDNGYKSSLLLNVDTGTHKYGVLLGLANPTGLKP